MRKVLIANRGEIAVRISRACRDAGLTSVAVYAEPDRDAVHVRLSDEAYLLGGTTPAESYLDVAKVLKAAADSGADAVHPGYGFLSENARFARAVLAAGLTWIGPPPSAIEQLGDKVAARELARRVGAPLVAGTPGPVSSADEVVSFARNHGLPIAIKAAHGGGGRGLKVARTVDEVPELFESARREALAAFGSADCFVEQYLDRPRHVETQCLADQYGDVVVVSTRDCTLQRRHQKVVEEAPAPFLTDEQRARLTESSKALLRAAGYVGAGTCEFLVGRDGLVSFLEVNTRLQVEHPVTEEVTGIDLVREQLRIADGEPLGYGDPEIRGHAVEFRINSEDPARGFLPAPGTVREFHVPTGPGVRVDSGVEAGTVIGPEWDSLLAKVIVTGSTRAEALRRAARVLAECRITGLATTLPFHRAVVSEPDFADEPFRVHTQWIETEFGASLVPHEGGDESVDAGPGRESVVVEVGGKRIEVSVPSTLGLPTTPGKPKRAVERRRSAPGAPSGSSDVLGAPMQGTVVRLAVANGQTVRRGDLVAVLEAMKMEQPLLAHKDGEIRHLSADVGQSLASGAALCEIKG